MRVERPIEIDKTNIKKYLVDTADNKFVEKLWAVEVDNKGVSLVVLKKIILSSLKAPNAPSSDWTLAWSSVSDSSEIQNMDVLT